MKKVISILVAIITVAFAAPGFAEYLPSNTDQRDVVPSRDLLVEFLGGEGYMPSRLELRKVSNEVVEDLASIAEDGSVDTTIRERAVDCLALYRSDATAHKTVRSLLDDVSQNSPLFDNALMSLAQLGGEKAVPTLAKFVDTDSESVRTAVVVALGRFGGQAGFELLKQRADIEQDENVQAHIARYVN
ncbi:MAG: HEAT repeat domain-containing protein [Myxococcota bacterium]